MSLPMPQPEPRSNDASEPPQPPLPWQLTANDHIESYEPRCKKPTTTLLQIYTDTYEPAPSGNMTHDPPKEHREDGPVGHDTPSELGDEGFEILSDSVALGIPASDGDAETLSLQSYTFDGATGDDVRSIAGSVHSTDSNTSEAFEQEREEHEHNDPVFKPSDSGMTARPNILSPSDSLSMEKLRHERVGLNELHVMEKIGHIHESELPGIREEYGVSRLDVVLQYSISKQSMTWSGPFRIMFAGPSATEMKAAVSQKIASALADIRLGAGMGPSRFSVFPVSFGNEKPEVQLIESPDFTLILDECVAAEHVRTPEPNALTRLTLSGGRKLDIPIFNTAVPFLPNLAVMSHRPKHLGEPEDESLRVFRETMKLRGIPVLHIAESTDLQSYFPSFIPEEESLGVIYQQPNGESVNALPVELETFMHLELMELNRHLACIGIRKDTVEEEILAVREIQNAVKNQDERPKNTVAGIFRDMSSHASAKRIWVSLIALLMALLLTQITRVAFPPQAVDQAGQEVALNSAIEAFKVAKTGVPLSLPNVVPNTTSISSAKPITDVVSSKNSEKSLGRPLIHPFSSKANESDEFKAHIIGDHHFVLTPPKRWASMRKPPKISISIHRGTEKVVHEGEQLVDGVYAVRLDRKDAYGTLNITVWTESKPQIQQSVAVDFGSFWLKMFDADGVTSRALSKVRTDIAIAQSNALNTSLQLYTGLQRIGNDTRNVAALTSQTALKLVDTALKFAEDGVQAAHERVGARRKRAEEMKAQLFEAAKNADFSKLWKKAAPSVRKAKPVHKAQKNAANLASKMGKKISELRSKIRVFPEDKAQIGETKELHAQRKGGKGCMAKKGKKSRRT